MGAESTELNPDLCLRIMVRIEIKLPASSMIFGCRRIFGPLPPLTTLRMEMKLNYRRVQGDRLVDEVKFIVAMPTHFLRFAEHTVPSHSIICHSCRVCGGCTKMKPMTYAIPLDPFSKPKPGPKLTPCDR